MEAKITLENFDALHDEQAVFIVTLPRQEGDLAGKITLDYSTAPHRVTLDFTHPQATTLAQSLALQVAINIIDTHFNPNAPEVQSEWSGDLYLQ